VSQTFYYS